MIDVNYFNQIPTGQSIAFVSRYLDLPCETIFVSAIVKDIQKSLPEIDRNEIYQLATAACRTKNPDIIWQIFKVETNFRAYILNFGGEKTIIGQAAKIYVENGLKKNDNVDIGPLQINWRANGSRYAYSPEQYFSGAFAVRFVSEYLLKDLVLSCKFEWINCYHSYNKTRGIHYREKIDKSGRDLKKILYSFLRI